ncbi:signal transduction histidine kinase [Bacilli bacterium PM5-3]|nr:signal transduction histidine kinase [Bacilli bacterium PM5-3]MDH6604241.1 signal transduction histidine kinase [Bacilli bacterium PM5-9]
MKNKNRSWRVFFLISIILYFLSLIVIFFLIKNVPTQYVNMQKKENIEVSERIERAVKNNDLEEYHRIIEDEYVDFIVYSKAKKQIEYSSLEVEDNLNIINKNANDNVISSKDVINIKRDNTEYEIWIIHYFLSPQKIFDIWVITLIIIVVSLLTIVVVALLILFFKYIRPIHRLKETVQNISSYQLNLIKDIRKKDNSEYDQITTQLQKFSIELEENMKETGYQYSVLERELLVKNESVEFKNELLGSLAHDLKAPLTLASLKLDDLTCETNKKDVSIIKNKIESVIDEINGINNIIFSDDESMFLNKENLNVIDIIMKAVSELEGLLEIKKFIIDYDIDEEVIMEVNELRFKQLVYNALSNIYYHANYGGEVVISCYRENDKVILSFYNDSDPLSEEDLNKIFSVFYKGESDNKNSGLGMYTMKSIVKEMNGEINAKNFNNGILIEVIFNETK